jgi:hypothetical protein
MDVLNGASYLDKANIGSLLTEALTADVEAVLADKTGLVGADAAIQEYTSARLHKIDLPFIIEIYSLSNMQSFLLLLLLVPCPARKSQKQDRESSMDVPLTRALAVGARARVPDRFVRHVCGWECGGWRLDVRVVGRLQKHQTVIFRVVELVFDAVKGGLGDLGRDSPGRESRGWSFRSLVVGRECSRCGAEGGLGILVWTADPRDCG